MNECRYIIFAPYISASAILAITQFFTPIAEKIGWTWTFVLAFSLAGACFYLQARINEKNSSENSADCQSSEPEDDQSSIDKTEFKE